MKKRILFVDDDEDILFCYRMSLESENLTIYTAQDSESALDIVIHQKIDVAVLDYMMPGVKGDELAKLVGQIDPRVKIYFVSGFDVALENVKRLNLSVYGVFMKPIEPDLIRKIAETEDYTSSVYQKLMSDLGNLYSNVYVE